MPAPRGGFLMANLIRRLAQAEGRIVSKGALIEAMYHGSREPEHPEKVLPVCICWARKRFPAGTITTHHGEGYSMDRAAGQQWLAQREA